MAVNSTAAFSGPYTANGATTEFPFAFVSASADEIAVTVDGVTLSPSAYVVARNDDGTGKVTITPALATGSVVVLSDPDFKQTTQFQRFGGYFPDFVNAPLDRAAIRDIAMKGKLDRALISPPGVDPIEYFSEFGFLPGPPGPTGPAFATFTSLATFKAAPVANKTQILQDSSIAFGQFNFETANAPYTADNISIIKADSTPLSTGAWVRQSGAGITYKQNAAGALTLTVTDKIKDVSLSPEDFGAKGDGVTNDTDAFVALAAVVNAAGGGYAVALGQGKTYIVGKQVFANGTGHGYAYLGADILLFTNCTKPIRIEGKGARIKLAGGLRFGAFNPTTGAAYASTPPFYTTDYAAGIGKVIGGDSCSGGITVEGPLEIDGNSGAIILGGEWGDTGYQLSAYGLWFNATPNTVTDVYTHHHGLDGIAVGHTGLTAAQVGCASKLSKVRSLYNSRQGLSWVGGRGLSADDCDFSFTGRGAFASAPKAGIDIEAESAVIRDGKFTNCRTIDNAGVGVLAPVGDVADVTFERHLSIGTTSYSAWPAMPGIKFKDSTFVGAVTNPYSTATPERATQFIRCSFLADVTLSPTGAVFLDSGQMLAFGGVAGTNVLLDGCRIDTGANSTAVFGTTSGVVIFKNTKMVQTGTGTSNTSSIYEGRVEVTTAGTFNSAVQAWRPGSTLILNGTEYPPPGGVEVAANDGVALKKVRFASYFSPTSWATSYGPAVVGDVVKNPVATGDVWGWECITAGGTSSGHWRALLRVTAGATLANAVAAVGAPTNAEFNAFITSYNSLLAQLRARTLPTT